MPVNIDRRVNVVGMVGMVGMVATVEWGRREENAGARAGLMRSGKEVVRVTRVKRVVTIMKVVCFICIICIMCVFGGRSGGGQERVGGIRSASV
jgi:hypothetical protein